MRVWKEMSLEDKFACAELIQAWGLYRDQRRWDELSSTFHPDGEIAVSWFRGPFHEFVEHCTLAGACVIRRTGNSGAKASSRATHT